MEMKARTTATQAIDWRSELMARWQALGRELFALDAEHRLSIEQFLAECTRIVVVWALVQTHGNLTHAALWIRSSRRTVRHHLVQWRKRNPQFVPPPRDLQMPEPDVEGEAA